MTDTHYHLALKNNQHWILEADPGLGDWLQHFTAILMLREAVPGEKAPSWRFSLAERENQKSPGDGWVSSWSQWQSIHAKMDGTDIITGIVPYDRSDKKEDVVRMMLAIQSLYLAVWPCSGIPVHAALLEREGQAILIAAPGGTGKSTCATRIPPPWRALCDDSVLMVPSGGLYCAHPLPTWSDFLMRDQYDRRWDVEAAVPVTGIWFLEHGDEDNGSPIGKGEAASRLYQSAVQISGACMRKQGNEPVYTDWHTALFSRCCDAVAPLSCGVLKATLEGRFWECL
mgnify:CR=1 FL=1